MNDSLPQLPEYDPADNLWDRIEANLQADELFTRLSHELPLHEPNPDLWNSIEANLSVSDTVKIRPLWQDVRVQWASLAATVALLMVGIWSVWPAEMPEKVHIEYATESIKPVSTQKSTNTNWPATTSRTEALIAKRCAQQKSVCQRPEVHELRKQLTALTLKQQRIEQEREIFGDDPTLLRAQTKLETQRAEVTKELLTLLES
ncbi:hypothetical protein [Spirosoma aerolatum]|uniref:hypothetical protein n=1 Tax=Spirosoma aerolatum TaxID=1211326 RepID=UPI0009AD4A69|nr:hypothetical protein [Spirosoma aerolatum]